MDNKSLIQKNAEKFSRWDDLLDSYLQLTFNMDDFSNEEGVDIFYSTNELLIEIARNFLQYGKFKDKWDDTKCHMHAHGQHLFLRSIKMDHDFNWGVDLNSFYLDTHIAYPENLKHMDDNFWKSLLQLSDFGEFKFVENSSIGLKQQQYFNNKKSNLFRLMRNYFLHDITNVSLEKYEQNFDFDLGWLEFRWKFGTPWEVIIENGCKAFKTLYQLNYQLWKAHDLKVKKANEKFG